MYVGVARRGDGGGSVSIYCVTFPVSRMQLLSFCAAHNM